MGIVCQKYLAEVELDARPRVGFQPLEAPCQMTSSTEGERLGEVDAGATPKQGECLEPSRTAEPDNAEQGTQFRAEGIGNRRCCSRVEQIRA